MAHYRSHSFLEVAQEISSQFLDHVGIQVVIFKVRNLAIEFHDSFLHLTSFAHFISKLRSIVISYYEKQASKLFKIYLFFGYYFQIYASNKKSELYGNKADNITKILKIIIHSFEIRIQYDKSSIRILKPWLSKKSETMLIFPMLKKTL